MTDETTTKPDDKLAEARFRLRQDFPTKAVGKLPRITCGQCRDARGKVCQTHAKNKCNECDNYITNAHMHLDYVGHAEVTDRLLSVDPEWTWEPLAWTEDGRPMVAKGASGEWVMWGRLTVLGVTRIGVGSVESNKFDAEKQLIGDFLRNAAMRFGVALNLWAKTELESALDEDAAPSAPEQQETGQRRPNLRRESKGKAKAPETGNEAESAPSEPTPRQALAKRINDLGADEKKALGAYCDEAGIVRKAADMSDDQIVEVNEWLDLKAAEAAAVPA